MTILKPDFYPKGWGGELWVCNNEKYCGKLLIFNKGKCCSWHYHNIKDETFFLHSGELLLEYSDEDDISTAKYVVLKPGDAFHIYPGLRHRMTALEDSQLFEFSTEHFEEDSIRVIKGD